jgi:hypothetical protein
MLTIRKRAVLLIVLCLVLSLALMAAKKPPGTPGEDQRTFSVKLTGAAERPGPGDADGIGTARIFLDQVTGEVCWEISVRNITLPATAAHIHRGTVDVAGPVVVPLSPPDASGMSSGCATADLALVKEIANNPTGFYVNVHTTDFPPGAVRGQLP